MTQSIWKLCIDQLSEEISEQDLQTYVLSLQAIETEGLLRLHAPNNYIVRWLEGNIRPLIENIIASNSPNTVLKIGVGSSNSAKTTNVTAETASSSPANKKSPFDVAVSTHCESFQFANFVEGNSNELGYAAAKQVAENPGRSTAYNPLYLYGASGLGKTHLMYAVYNAIKQQQPHAKIALINANQYLQHMVQAVQNHNMDEFKNHYNNIDALLMDDVQFLAQKERTQEEFFHTFNNLIEQGKQIILTCDQYPDEVDGLDARLRSRFGSGLPIQINPPELETRVGILIKKAEQMGWELPEDTAFFIAKHIQSNVRVLEGALSRLIAVAGLKNADLTIELAKNSLKDVLQLREKRISIENIQRTVADHYKLKLADLMSKNRSRSIARPRQLAMCLAKELTTLSLPEIGREFGGRDHTTVLHAVKTINDLKQSNTMLNNDYDKLIRILQS